MRDVYAHIGVYTYYLYRQWIASREYRGHFGERDPWQTQGGSATEPVLRALNIPYDFLTDPSRVEKQIAEAQTWAASSLHPAALLLTRDLMWEDVKA